MCGLVFSTRDALAGSAEWKRSIEVLSCRGPDAVGAEHAGGYSAGHCRLAVIGLGPAGRQPYSDDPRQDVLVFNGEIYNYREVGKSLGLSAESDTQVLYHLLHRGFEDRLSELRGMFAFVYWRRDPETVIAARDFFGIKPLFFSLGRDNNLSFASVAAALAHLTHQPVADPVAIAGFLATGYFAADTSAFDDIQKLPPGTVMTWRRHGRDWERAEAPLHLESWSTVSPADAVVDSVRAHLVSDVPVGVLLSGGVDSTLIAAMAAQDVDDLRTFSLTNPGNPSIDEAAYARWNAHAIGSRHTEVPFESGQALAVVGSLVRSGGEPFGDAAYIPLAVLCERVAQDIKVVLAGEGADELFGGYRRYGVERFRYQRLTGRPLRHLSRLQGGGLGYLDRAPSQRARTWAHWSEADDYLAHSYLLSSEWAAVTAAQPVAGPAALAERRRTWSAVGTMAQSLGLPSHKAYDVTQWLPNVFLEKSDRASMLHGVEVRVPFLDPMVARASMSVTSRGTTKEHLRSALLATCPQARLPPRKMGLSVDVATLISSSGLSQYVRFALEDPQSVLRSSDGGRLDLLARRAALNPVLSFRLGVLGMWQHEWLRGDGS